MELQDNRCCVTRLLSNLLYDTDNPNKNRMAIAEENVNALSGRLFSVYDDLDACASYHVALANQWASNCRITENYEKLVRRYEYQKSYYEAVWKKYGTIKQVYDFCATNMNYQELLTRGPSFLNKSNSIVSKKSRENSK
jgi:hypothetical protein